MEGCGKVLCTMEEYMWKGVEGCGSVEMEGWKGWTEASTDPSTGFPDFQTACTSTGKTPSGVHLLTVMLDLKGYILGTLKCADATVPLVLSIYQWDGNSSPLFQVLSLSD